MNWYIALGTKIFTIILLVFQAVEVLRTFGRWADKWLHDEKDKWLFVVGIIDVITLSAMIAMTYLIFNS